MRDILKTIFVIIGTMIGAGFASGQEIYLFFNRYGTMGILGLIISCTLAGIIIYKVFQIVKNKKTHTYSEFLETISSNKKINKIMQVMIQGFLLVSFYIMVAGFSAYFNQEFRILIYVPAVIMAILCYITFINDTKGIVYINTILIPFLCSFIYYLGIKNLGFTNTYFENNSGISDISTKLTLLCSGIPILKSNVDSILTYIMVYTRKMYNQFLSKGSLDLPKDTSPEDRTPIRVQLLENSFVESDLILGLFVNFYYEHIYEKDISNLNKSFNKFF